MMKKRLLITVHGKVQNVGFRFYTQRWATELGLSGFVKNQPDGTVYIEAEGPEEHLEQFMDSVRSGPRWANVRDVNFQEAPLMDEKHFIIKG